MIGYLRGRVVYRDESEVILDCGGIGYELAVTSAALSALPLPGSEGEIYVHFSATDNGTALYGFASLQERQLFRLLNSVSSVGPKVAIALLSGMGVDGTVEAIASGNSMPLTKVKGVGKKIAERVVLELKEKVADVWALAPVSELKAEGKAEGAALRDALEALLQLGYRRSDAVEILAGLPRRETLDSAGMIREALKRLR